MDFNLKSEYQPTGDQPEAIRQLTEGLKNGTKFQTLLGVTGSGKTFTVANVLSQVKRPALVLSHNKTLAAQLYGEFKQFFPENAVEYFVSYYDYYQPEAYIAVSDTYIEKDAKINEEIDKYRHAATATLSPRTVHPHPLSGLVSRETGCRPRDVSQRDHPGQLAASHGCARHVSGDPAEGDTAI